jgi:hypothetical protein
VLAPPAVTPVALAPAAVLPPTVTRVDRPALELVPPFALLAVLVPPTAVLAVLAPPVPAFEVLAPPAAVPPIAAVPEPRWLWPPELLSEEEVALLSADIPPEAVLLLELLEPEDVPPLPPVPAGSAALWPPACPATAGLSELLLQLAAAVRNDARTTSLVKERKMRTVLHPFARRLAECT